MTNKRKAITTAAAAVVLAFSSFSMSVLSGSLASQNMAKRWQSGDLKYSQISVFYPQGGKSAWSAGEAEMMRSSIEDQLKSGSFKADSSNADVWTDSFCSAMSPANVSVYNEDTARTDSISSEFGIIGTGGDFFAFHPLKLISGNYIYEGELRNNRAVLDEQAAWNIFRSVDVEGMKFSVNGMEFEVAGVVKPEENSAVEKTYPEKPLIYVHYDVLEDIGMDISLLCYESVIPNPVTNYARNIIRKKFGINTMELPEDGTDPEKSLDVVITENTGRYSLPKLWESLRKFDETAVSDRSIPYPYWENAARVTGVRMTILFFTELLALTYIILMIIVTAAKLYLNRKWHLGEFLEEMMYRYTYRKRTSDYISLDINDTDEGKEKKYEQ